MSKKIIFSVVGIAILAFVGWSIYSKSIRNVGGSNSSSQEEVEVDTTSEESMSGSILDLASRGGNYECTFSHSTQVGSSNGVVYISGNKIRGNFVSEVTSVVSMTVNSYMISDGDFTYTWTDMTSQGYKAPVDYVEDSSANTSQSFDYNQSLDYTCKGWVVDPQVFVLPSGIEFIQV